MLPPFTGCRDRALPGPGQYGQALAPPSLVPQGQTMAWHASLLWASVFRGFPTPQNHRVCFQDHSSQKCPMLACFCRAWHQQWMGAEPPLLLGHRSQAGSPALLLLQHSCRDCAHVAQLWAVHKHCLSLSYFSHWRREFSYKKVKENLQNLFCIQGTLLKKKIVQQYLRPNVWIQTSSKSKANSSSFILFHLNWTKWFTAYMLFTSKDHS